MKAIVTTLLLLGAQTLDAGIKTEEKIIPGLKLRIEGEIPLTDNNGVVIPSQVIKLEVGKLVSMYRTDLFCYKGQITEIEESAEALKIYGKILNVPESRFGFILARGGNFAGAIVEGDENNRTYVLEFSPSHKGFVFIRNTKYEKPQL
jgi:hypothetical protein